MKYCNNCGNPINDDDIFCNTCGQRLDKINEEKEKGINKAKRRKMIIIIICIAAAAIVAFAIIYRLMSDSVNNAGNSNINTVSEGTDSADSTKSIVLQVDNDCIITNEETEITFTALLDNAAVSPILINGDKQICELNDQGINGDATAEDGIYTCILSINAETVGENAFYVQADTTISNQVIIYSFDIPDESDMEQIENEYNEVSALIEETAEDYLTEEGYVVPEQKSAVLDSIEARLESEINNGNIRFYNRNDGSIYVKLSSGIGLLYEPPIKGASAGVNLDGPQIMFFEPHSDIDNDLEDLLFNNDDHTINETDKFSGVSTIEGSDVTLESIKNIPSGSIIFWNGHGLYDERLHSCLAMGEEVDVLSEALSFGAMDLFSQEFRDLVEDRIILGSADNKTCWLVTSKYIDKYCGDLTNDIFLLASCYSAKDEVLADALINKGAATVVGFDDTVATRYALSFCIELLYSMTDEMNSDSSDYCTVLEAFDLAKDIWGESDIEYTAPENNYYPIGAQPVLIGNEDVRIGGLNEVTVYIKNENDEIINIDFDVTLTDENDNVITLEKDTDEAGQTCYKASVPSGDYDLYIDGDGYLPLWFLETINTDRIWDMQVVPESEIGSSASSGTGNQEESESAAQASEQTQNGDLSELIHDIYIRSMQNKEYEMNGIGFEYEATGYAIIDLNQDGTDELIVNSELKSDPAWGQALVFTYNPTYDSAEYVGCMDYYTSLSYSDTYKCLVFNGTKPSANAGSYEFRYFDKDHFYTDFTVGWELNFETYIPEYYIYDGTTRSPLTESEAQAYISEPQSIEFSPMP